MWVLIVVGLILLGLHTCEESLLQSKPVLGLYVLSLSLKRKKIQKRLKNLIRIQVLLKRVVEVFDADLNGEVDFKEFVMGLAQFRFEFSH